MREKGIRRKKKRREGRKDFILGSHWGEEHFSVLGVLTLTVGT